MNRADIIEVGPKPKIGKPRVKIREKEAFYWVFRNSLPAGDIEVALSQIEKEIRAECKAQGCRMPATSAFGKCRGAWFEFIALLTLWNAPKPAGTVIVRLPSVRSLKFPELFDTDTRKLIKELEDHLESNGTSLHMSNPDLICVSGLAKDKELTDYFKPVSSGSEKNILHILNAYTKVTGKCAYNGLRFGASLKTSIRPDRRYQPIHEGTVVKAFIAHLATRHWKKKLNTRYHVIVLEATDMDRKVLTCATAQSFVDVWSEPRPSVDKVITPTTVDELHDSLQTMLA